jgi:hypothetical protein
MGCFHFACLGVWGYFVFPAEIAIYILIGALVVALLAYLLGRACRFVLTGPRVTTTDAVVNELNKIEKDLNERLGYAPGTGPRTVVVDGELKTVNIGYEERIKNPNFVFGQRLADVFFKQADLEASLKKAVDQSDWALASKIKAEMTALEAETAALEREATALIKNHVKQEPSADPPPVGQNGSPTAGEEPITMATVTNMRKEIMESWEEALKTARTNGNWRDVEACGAICEAFHDRVRKALTSGAFSGDAAAATAIWDEIGRAESEYRRFTEAEARDPHSK